MSNSMTEKRLKMSGSGNYVIRVQGYLEEIWSDRLGNMEITPKFKDGAAPESQLVGTLKDQAELIGVLNGIYELRLPILYVEYVGVKLTF